VVALMIVSIRRESSVNSLRVRCHSWTLRSRERKRCVAASANATEDPGSRSRTATAYWTRPPSARRAAATPPGRTQPTGPGCVHAPVPTTRSRRRRAPVPSSSVLPARTPLKSANVWSSSTSPGARAARPEMIRGRSTRPLAGVSISVM
jgi:hypothetical protein